MAGELKTDDVCVSYFLNTVVEEIGGERLELRKNREAVLTIVDDHDCHIEIIVRRVREEGNRPLKGYELKEVKT